MKIKIGTRGSKLALWQANETRERLQNLGVEVEIIIIKTQGDKIQHLSFDKMEGKGFFTKEIEEKLLNCEIDLAVHSHKDLETHQPDGLSIVAVSEREDPSDILLIKRSNVDEGQIFNLKKNAVVGTSSARRKSQLLFFRPDLQIIDLRGNVPTRINKLRSENYDAIMLASAGVERLKLDVSDLHSERLDPKEFIPAAAQGVLAWQTRKEDAETIRIVQELNNEEVAKRIEIERGILKACNGGCQLPLGVFCQGKDDFDLWVSHAADLNSELKRFHLNGNDSGKLINEAMNIIKGEKKKF